MIKKKERLQLEWLRLEEAEQRITRIEKHIDQQRKRIKREEVRGNPIRRHEATLFAMLETLYIVKYLYISTLQKVDFLAKSP